MHLDQARAQRAFSFVRAFKEDREALLELARKLPFMFHTNGLLATWAHLLAKAKGEEKSAKTSILRSILEHLQGELVAPRVDRSQDGANPQRAFDTWLDEKKGLSGRELRAYTAEAIEYAVWLKRAAEALCDTKSEKPSKGKQP